MSQNGFVDAHVHLDHLVRAGPEVLRELREAGCFPVSWAFSKRIDAKADLVAYLERQGRLMREIDRDRLACRYLAGVHPRNIPQDLHPEDVREILLPRFDDAQHGFGLLLVRRPPSTDPFACVLRGGADRPGPRQRPPVLRASLSFMERRGPMSEDRISGEFRNFGDTIRNSNFEA